MNLKQLFWWTVGIWAALEWVFGSSLVFIALFGWFSFSALGAAWGTLLTVGLLLPFVWGVTRWGLRPWFRRITTLERVR